MKKGLLWGICGLAAAGVLFVVYVGYAFLSGTRMLPRLWVGTVSVGGLSRADATAAVGEAIQKITNQGITVVVGDTEKKIRADDISLSYNIAASIDQAASYGKLPFKGIPQLVRNGKTTVPLIATYSTEELEQSIHDIADATDIPLKDLELTINKGTVSIATAVSPGLALNKNSVQSAVIEKIIQADINPVIAERTTREPRITQASAETAKTTAEQMVKNPIELNYKDRTWVIPSTVIGSWITSTPADTELILGIQEKAIARYITTVAADINTKTTAPKLIVENGKVTDFHMPKPSAALEEQNAIDTIMATLEERKINSDAGKTIALSVNESTPPALPENFLELGIRELIGKATTSFAGSPQNRKGNIKNGVKFLTGILLDPSVEFSTIKTLGTIDNTTGYLPELVIKGDRTTPEFGGGLCQVSTTLFRAVMNAGLPITARSAHSYRVSYYEKDGNGRTIGPGLDATIYDPVPDFKFINDTPGKILIMGYVVGDKVTFEIYGTGDGRTSTIDGPHTLTSSPPGDPIYIKTTEVPEGTTKQVEKPHPGGTAVATYTVMRDGAELHKKVFKSVYRPWPARYLVGVSQATLEAEQKTQKELQQKPNTVSTTPPGTPSEAAVNTSTP